MFIWGSLYCSVQEMVTRTLHEKGNWITLPLLVTIIIPHSFEWQPHITLYLEQRAPRQPIYCAARWREAWYYFCFKVMLFAIKNSKMLQDPSVHQCHLHIAHIHRLLFLYLYHSVTGHYIRNSYISPYADLATP